LKIILVGTKRDLPFKADDEKIHEIFDENDVYRHILTSSVTGEGIKELFDAIVDEDNFF